MNKSQGCWKCPVLSSLPLPVPAVELWNSGCGSRLFFAHVSTRSSQATQLCLPLPQQTLLNSLPWSESRSRSSSRPLLPGPSCPSTLPGHRPSGCAHPKVRAVGPWDVQASSRKDRGLPTSAGWGGCTHGLVLDEQNQPGSGLRLNKAM